MQGEMRVGKDGARSGRELLFAGRLQALENLSPLVLACAPAGDPAHAVTSANSAAHDAIGPAHLFEVSQALLVSGELRIDVYQVHAFIVTEY